MKKNIKAQIRTMKTNRLQAFIRAHRAQIKMSETIAILFIFFVLVVFGLIFYYKYSQIAAKEKQEELLAMKARDITLKSLFLPELICSKGFEPEPIDFCIDVMKLRQVEGEEGIFSKYRDDYYFDLFPYTKITVARLYPEPYEGWVLYDKPKPVWTSKEESHFVVALRDESSAKGEFSFGVLTIEVYS